MMSREFLRQLLSREKYGRSNWAQVGRIGKHINIAPIVTWVFLAIVLIVSWFAFRGMKKKDAEVNRAADDLI